jgi:outer membrane protein assembly factor BamB
VGDQILLTTFRRSSNELAVVALDVESGAVRWRRAVTASRVEATHALGSPATATLACDGTRIFAFFGSYGLRCIGLDGTPLWERRMGPFQDEYGAGSSPVIVDGKVILNEDHDIDSFLAAYDTTTGAEIWKVARPDAVRSYSTPAVWIRDGRKEIVVAGALELAGYDSRTGEKLWNLQGLARIVIPTSIPADDRVYVASWAPGGDSNRRIQLLAWPAALAKWDQNQDAQLAKAEIQDNEVLDRFFRMDRNQDGRLDEAEWIRHANVFQRAQNALLAVRPTGRGDLSEGSILWKHSRGIPYVATPLLDRGFLWMVKDGGIVTQLDAKDGRVMHEERVPGIGNYFASPVAGDGKVYFASEPGTVSIIAEGSEWRVLSSHTFDEKIYATPLLYRGRLHIRTEAAIYAFGSEVK